MVVVAFSSLARILREDLSNHSQPAAGFFFVCVYVFKVEISSCTQQFHFLSQDQSTMA